MTRPESFRSRADEEFESAFLGAPVRREPRTSPPTPRAEKTSEAMEAAVQPVGVTRGTGKRLFHDTTPLAEVKMASADISPVDSAIDMPGRPTARHPALGGGTGVISGSDVGQLPPADTKPMQQSTAPETGKRAPAPSARAVTDGILKSLLNKGRKGQVPGSPVPVPPATAAKVDTRETQPANDGRDRMSFTTSGVNGSELHTGYSREKAAGVLRCVGVPANLVGEGSVLWEAVSEKLAAAASIDESAYFGRDDTHPMALWTQLGSRYGDEWLTWDLETIQQTLAADVGVEPSSSTMNKVAALQMVTTKPELVHSDWHLFEKIAVAFNGGAPRLTLIEDLSPEEMAFAASVMRMIAPDPRPVDGWQFSVDMQKYCAARLYDAGMVIAPPELGFCDAELKRVVGQDREPLRKSAMAMYVSALAGKEPRDIDTEAPPPEFVQAARLMRIHAYVLDKIDDLVRQAL